MGSAPETTDGPDSDEQHGDQGERCEDHRATPGAALGHAGSPSGAAASVPRTLAVRHVPPLPAHPQRVPLAMEHAQPCAVFDRASSFWRPSRRMGNKTDRADRIPVGGLSQRGGSCGPAERRPAPPSAGTGRSPSAGTARRTRVRGRRGSRCSGRSRGTIPACDRSQLRNWGARVRSAKPVTSDEAGWPRFPGCRRTKPPLVHARGADEYAHG